VWAPAAFQGWCIRRPPGNGQLDEILVKFMIKPEIRRVDHEREVARVRLTGQGRDARQGRSIERFRTGVALDDDERIKVCPPGVRASTTKDL
jgi:hypothetical protein